MKGTFLAFLLCLALALGGLGAAAHTLGCLLYTSPSPRDTR